MQSKFSFVIAGLLFIAGGLGYYQFSQQEAVNASLTETAPALIPAPNPALNIAEAPFGTLPGGEHATLFTLTNANGLVVKISNFGGVITSIITPDKHGNSGDIVLGFNDVEGYIKNPSFFGALVGRYANRIDKGQFELNGEKYQLAVNSGGNHLHGGVTGFDKVLWQTKSFTTENSVGLVLTHFSPDGDQGYPGNLTVNATYELTNNNELMITYKATTDKSTPINLTQHPYFNLAGSGTILEHKLEINADRYTPINDNLIPTGEYRAVDGTPFDFTKSHKIGDFITQEDPQLKSGGGYDHNWVLNKNANDTWGMGARVYEPGSGRILEVWTDSPGMQFYSGNFLNGKANGKGTRFVYRGALCLEPQSFPDSPNKPDFPTTILSPDTEYSRKIMFRFLVE